MTKSFAAVVRKVAEQHSDVADYRQLGSHVLAEIEGRERELLERLLPSYLRAVLSKREHTDSDEEAWDSFLRERVPTTRGMVFAAQATADEMQEAADRRVTFAGRLGRRAEHFAAVADRMRATDAKVVEDLKGEDVTDVIQSLEVALAFERFRKRQAQSRARALESLEQTRDHFADLLAKGATPTVDHLLETRDTLRNLLTIEEAREVRGQYVRRFLREAQAGG